MPPTVLTAIEPLPGRAVAVEVDLTVDDVAARLFDEAESRLGPVSILVNNASGWVADTFTPDALDRLGRGLTGVTPATIDRNLGVDARAGALLIAELARRHVARGARWGRIVGLTLGRTDGVPPGGLLRRRQGGAGELHDGRVHRAGPVRDHRQHRAPAGHRHRLDHRRGPAGR